MSMNVGPSRPSAQTSAEQVHEEKPSSLADLISVDTKMENISERSFKVLTKGKKQRGKLLKALKDGNYNKHLFELVALRETVNEKINEHLEFKDLFSPAKVTHAIKAFVANIFNHRKSELMEIRETLQKEIDFLKKEQHGLPKIKALIKSLGEGSELSEEGVFRVSGSAEEIKNWMGGNRDITQFQEMDVHTKIGILKALVRENLRRDLTTIFPAVNESNEVLPEGAQAVKKKLYEEEPTLKKLFELLNEAAKGDDMNKMDAKNLAISIGPAIFEHVDPQTDFALTPIKIAFVKWMIENPE